MDEILEIEITDQISNADEVLNKASEEIIDKMKRPCDHSELWMMYDYWCQCRDHRDQLKGDNQ